MSLPVNPGFEGFEDPEDWYPGNVADLPILFTGAYQIRQFGAGNATALRPGLSVLSALATPPANMVTANNLAKSYLGGISNLNGNPAAGFNYPVTSSDYARYFPGTSADDGGSP